MKAGDSVKLVRVPLGLKDDDELKTKSLFEQCLGKNFKIASIDNFDGKRLAALDVGHVVGEASYMHTIWVEEEYLEAQKSS
jgi:hypothetical protein